MASLVDQTDESELLPPDHATVQTWLQRYTLAMGAAPEEEEEPTEAQLAGLHKRTLILDQAPYVDFAVWVPFGRRALKTQKFRVYHPLGDGSYLMREMPGPQNFREWLSSWRVFKVAALMLGILSLAVMLSYEKLIERLVVQWPQAWGLICQAEDKARAEKLEKIRRGMLLDEAQGKSMPADWDKKAPWTACWRALVEDEKYWSEQVRHPAVAWTAMGGKGAPKAASELIAATHLPGFVDGIDPPPQPHPEWASRKKQANRDKRQAKKRRLLEDRDELARLRAGPQKAEVPKSDGAKGSSKGKSKDQAGNQLCFSWSTGVGVCADVPPGGECRGKVKRAHKCQICLSPAHRNSDCPSR
eukprot:s2768_g6.t1